MTVVEQNQPLTFLETEVEWNRRVQTTNQTKSLGAATPGRFCFCIL